MRNSTSKKLYKALKKAVAAKKPDNIRNKQYRDKSHKDSFGRFQLRQEAKETMQELIRENKAHNNQFSEPKELRLLYEENNRLIEEQEREGKIQKAMDLEDKLKTEAAERLEAAWRQYEEQDPDADCYTRLTI